jgi:hypothetical protein
VSGAEGRVGAYEVDLDDRTPTFEVYVIGDEFQGFANIRLAVIAFHQCYFSHMLSSEPTWL